MHRCQMQVVSRQPCLVKAVLLFGTITFTKAGTYTYHFSEVQGTAQGYTYDDTVYDVIVVVTDDDGELILTATIAVDEEIKDAIVFTNPYDPEEVDLELGATKVLKGKPLTANAFTFTLSDENSRVLQTVTNDGSGHIAFAAMTYTEPGVYTYTIKETIGQEKDMVYDKTIYAVIVTVTDEGGYLVATADKDADAVVFQNVYEEEIPKTGEANPIWPILAGTALLLSAGVLFLIRRRRKQEDA